MNIMKISTSNVILLTTEPQTRPTITHFPFEQTCDLATLPEGPLLSLELKTKQDDKLK